ncbi:hypothetical protein B0H14DRAFT_3520653 [Mycena olivaceomarginata]|nr:hypothetical protein B0H14DRAFT_3520653 [Mycena olivaceomarginata]
MISQWEKQQVQHPETAHIVQQGINKLEFYRERVKDVPAYILSILINPAIKLSWLEKFRPERVQGVKDLFLCELEGYHTNPSNTPTESSQANWADEIFCMDTPGCPTRRQSLEDEARAHFFPYSFGSENQLWHLTIFELAVDILPIQGRNCTVPDLMEAFQMLEFSVKKGRRLNFEVGIVSTLPRFLHIILWVVSTPQVVYLSGYHTLFDSFRVLPHILTYDIRPPREDAVQLVLLLGKHTSY